MITQAIERIILLNTSKQVMEEKQFISSTQPSDWCGLKITSTTKVGKYALTSISAINHISALGKRVLPSWANQYTLCTYVQLFLLHCTTTCCQPGISFFNWLGINASSRSIKSSNEFYNGGGGIFPLGLTNGGGHFIYLVVCNLTPAAYILNVE